MEFASGLDSPKLALPKPDTKLVLTKPGKLLSKAKAASAASTPKPGTAPTGATRALTANILTKKFKTKPTTHAETRDCETELTYEALQMVHRGPKIVDFGRFCLNSRQVKPFSVS